MELLTLILTYYTARSRALSVDLRVLVKEGVRLQG